MKRKLMLSLVGLFVGIGLVTAQVQHVTGVVISEEDDIPVVGASVLVKGTQVGAITDIDGKFTLNNVPETAKILVVSYIGMQTQEISIKPVVKIALRSNTEKLDEVIVVAYGTAKKESLTGAISVVDKKKIEKRVSTSVTGALEGSAPGVQVNNTYGEPGKAPKIRIRGFGTLVKGASEPLYVVDGVPFDGDNMAELNSNDIESMSILKDAASSALYGNRAANGVVLITTKQGRSGKPSINLSINQGIYNRGIPEYNRLDSDPWMEAEWKAKKYAMMTNKGMSATEAAAYATENLIAESISRNIYNAADNKLFDANGRLIATRLPGYDDLDWEDAIERNGHRQEYNLSAATSGEKYNIYSSVGYLKEKGYVKASGYERFSGRINSSYTPNKWLKVGVNLMATHTTRQYNNTIEEGGNSFNNPFYITRYMAPVYPLYMHNQDGSYQYDKNGDLIYDTTSPYLSNRNIAFELEANREESVRNMLAGQAFATITLPYGLSVTLKGDLNYSNENYMNYGNPLIGDGAANKGRLTNTFLQYKTETFQQMLNWNYTFNQVHNMEVLLGHESYSWERKYNSGMNTGMAVEGNLTMGNFLTNAFFGGYNDQDKTESYLARAKYNYDHRYYIEGSFRRDGSSRFNKDNRWGNFFSVGISWNMKREVFLKDVTWIDALKLRTSYGEVGNNMGVGYYAHMPLYYIDKNGGQAALLKQSLGAPDIKWETTQTVDVALEGRLFNRLNVQVGYFDKRSKDLLFQVRLPLSAGSFPNDKTNMNFTQYKNIGIISNRGWEISLNADLINSKDWRWNLGIDATFLKNKIVKLPNGKDIMNGMQKYSEGHSIYEYFTYHYEGVDQMTGTALYTLDEDKRAAATEAKALININGKDYATATSYAKRDWAGSALPTVYGSIQSGLSWKNWDLNILFTYSLGGKTYDGIYSSLMTPSESGRKGGALHEDVLKSWDGAPAGITETSPNRINPDGTPRLDFYKSQDLNAASDRWLTSASYLVFKNIALSYSFPRRWIHKLGIEGLSLNAGIENLFTLTSRKGLNPQYSFNGAQADTFVTARVYNFGINVKF